MEETIHSTIRVPASEEKEKKEKKDEREKGEEKKKT